MLREDLVSRLIRLDEDAFLVYGDSTRFQIIIVGGGALVLMNAITRATQDIDAILPPAELRDLMSRYDMNSNVMAYIDYFPYNFEDRIKPVDIAGRCIDYYTASLEDIVIAKLFSNRPTDIVDITRDEVVQAIDWDVLDSIVSSETELTNNAISERRMLDFRYNYEEYVRRFRLCES